MDRNKKVVEMAIPSTYDNLKRLKEKHQLTYSSVSLLLDCSVSSACCFLTGQRVLPNLKWRFLNILLGENDPKTDREIQPFTGVIKDKRTLSDEETLLYNEEISKV